MKVCKLTIHKEYQDSTSATFDRMPSEAEVRRYIEYMYNSNITEFKVRECFTEFYADDDFGNELIGVIEQITLNSWKGVWSEEGG